MHCETCLYAGLCTCLAPSWGISRPQGPMHAANMRKCRETDRRHRRHRRQQAATDGNRRTDSNGRQQTATDGNRQQQAATDGNRRPLPQQTATDGNRRQLFAKLLVDWPSQASSTSQQERPRQPSRRATQTFWQRSVSTPPLTCHRVFGDNTKTSGLGRSRWEKRTMSLDPHGALPSALVPSY